MAQNQLLTSINWPLLERLRRALASGERDPRLVLASQHYFADERDRERLREITEVYGGRYPSQILLPLALRTDPAAYAASMLDWISTIDAERRDRALVEACRTGLNDEVPVKYWVLLSYFSEAYRLDVVGLTGEDPNQVLYDGDETILKAAGGLAGHGESLWTLYSPQETRKIADALSTLDISPYPKGDLTALIDLYEDAGYDGEMLHSECREGVQFLKDYYQRAAQYGWGVRVTG